MTEITQTDLDDELTVFASVYLLGCKDGAEKERAAIVAWLRDKGVASFALGIGQGEHLK